MSGEAIQTLKMIDSLLGKILDKLEEYACLALVWDLLTTEFSLISG